jgi:hypothetical protein
VPADTDFYSACAQVLPVLFLAVAVEFRFFGVTEAEVTYWKESDDNVGLNVGFHVVAIAGYVTTLVLGEGAALRVLSTGENLRGAEELVIGSLAASGAVLMLAPVIVLFGTVSNVVDEEKWATRLTTLALVAVVIVWITPFYGLGLLIGIV